MPNCDKLLRKARQSPNNLRFEALLQLAECFGFLLDRQEGSHRIYKNPTYRRTISFQERLGKAKPYQVRQLLAMIEELELERDSNEE